MTAGGVEGGRETRTDTPWGTQDSGAGAIHGDARAGGGNTKKASSATADDAGARGRHGARPVQRGKMEAGGKIKAAKPQECGATTGAARTLEWPTSPLEWGTRRGSARPPEWRKTRGGPATEWAGESSRHRVPTPPEWQSFPGGTKLLEGPQRPRADRGRKDGGGEETTPLPHLPSNQVAGIQQQRRQANGRAEDGGADRPTAGHGGGRRQHREPAKAYLWHQRRQAGVRCACTPQVRLTGAGRDSGRPSRRRGHR